MNSQPRFEKNSSYTSILRLHLACSRLFHFHMRRFGLETALATAVICVGAGLGPATTEAQEPEGGAVLQQPGGPRQRVPASQDQAPVVIERPDETAVQPPPQCAAEPQCAQGSVAICTASGVCQRGSNRPEQACLNYSCVAKLQPISPQLAPKHPLVVAPKVQPGIVGAP